MVTMATALATGRLAGDKRPHDAPSTHKGYETIPRPAKRAPSPTVGPSHWWSMTSSSSECGTSCRPTEHRGAADVEVAAILINMQSGSEQNMRWEAANSLAQLSGW